MGFKREEESLWNDLLESLRLSHVRVQEREDKLVWEHAPLGEYTPKEGCKNLSDGGSRENSIWWWKVVWKFKCPPKKKIISCGVCSTIMFWLGIFCKKEAWRGEAGVLYVSLLKKQILI